MSDSDPSGRNPEGSNREVHGGGSPSRGPNPDPGGDIEPGGLVPPYEGRSTVRGESESSEALTESLHRQITDADGSSGGTASPAHEHPVDPSEVTDREPESALGVGESINRRGEDMVDDDGKEAGREDAGRRGASERPTGVSDARDVTGVDPQD